MDQCICSYFFSMHFKNYAYKLYFGPAMRFTEEPHLDPSRLTLVHSSSTLNVIETYIVSVLHSHIVSVWLSHGLFIDFERQWLSFKVDIKGSSVIKLWFGPGSMIGYGVVGLKMFSLLLIYSITTAKMQNYSN